MAGKRNIVNKTKGSARLITVAALAAGWLMAAAAAFSQDDVRSQEEMIVSARQYLEDRLYVRTISGYREALAAYQTENNPRYEDELLAIYKEAGMQEEYYGMLENRAEARAAGAEEYLELAEFYLDRGSVFKAVPILKQGIESCHDDELTALYESVIYEYSAAGTTFTQTLMPAADWYIPAYDGEHWGYIGADGRTLLDFIYEEATCFSGSYAVVKLDGVYTLIDKKGYRNAVDKNGIDRVTSFVGGRLTGVKDGRYAIYNNVFRKISEESYDDIRLSENGTAAVCRDGRWALLDTHLEEVTDYRFTDVAADSRGLVFYGNYGVVADETGYFLVDQTGEPYFEKRFANAKGIESGLFAVADASGKWGFANAKGELVVECQYEDACSFSDHLAAVLDGDKWGYINRYNTKVIEAQFTQAQPFLAGKAMVKDAMGNVKILTLKYYDYF